MKVVTVPQHAAEINALLAQARQEDLLLRSADGGEFMLVAVEDFDEEIARTRQNEKFMALLDARAKQTHTVSLEEVKRLCTKSPVRNLTHRSTRTFWSHSDVFSRPDRPDLPVKTPPRNDFLCKAGPGAG